MAKPRIFLSSTFYDLKHIRNDLELFIKIFGYESVLNEKGNIPYEGILSIENDCYKEIESCDIIVSLIGGRYGSNSEHNTYSISQNEFKNAQKLGKQIYIFIEKNVDIEYNTYIENKTIIDIKYKYVDNIKIYEFIEELKSINNNIIFSFESSIDIINILKEQWAGLFQRLLKIKSKTNEIDLLNKINSTSETLNQLVTYLTNEKNKSSNAISSILLNNHPAFERLKQIFDVKFRIYFTNYIELAWLLKSVFDYKLVPQKEYLKFINDTIKPDPWYQNADLLISKEIFDKSEEHRLKIFTNEDWKDEYIKILDSNENSDDIPF